VSRGARQAILGILSSNEFDVVLLAGEQIAKETLTHQAKVLRGWLGCEGKERRRAETRERSKEQRTEKRERQEERGKQRQVERGKQR
jgi:hypothetical protein